MSQEYQGYTKRYINLYTAIGSRAKMQIVFHSLAIATLLLPSPTLSQVPSPMAPTLELAQAPQAINVLIPVALPVSAKVWLKAGGTTTGQVTGFDAQRQVLTLGGEAIPVARIGKVAFDRKALAYTSDGKPLKIRGEDNAKAKPSAWSNLALNAFQLKDARLGQALVNLAGAMQPTQLRGIRSVAVRSVYVVDEIQFQGAGKMTIRVMPSDR